MAPPSSKRAYCPSCGRYVGPYATCPYCGARLQGRLSLTFVKVAALGLAIIGLACLWYCARRVEVPTLAIGDVQGLMNMAYVRLEGHVARSPTFDPESDYLAFWVDDGTGEAYVSVYRDVTRSLLAAGTIPAAGDAVTVAGTLRVREDFVSMTLNVPEHLSLSRPEPAVADVGALTPLDEGLRVQVSGVVGDVSAPYEGLTLITLHDDAGSVVVAVDAALVALTGALPELVPGQQAVVTGTVHLYRGQPQLVPASVTDIVLAAPPEDVAAATPTLTPTPATQQLGRFSLDNAGQQVRVQGVVVGMTGFKGGLKATLDDGTGQIILLLWQSVYAVLPEPLALDLGAAVIVCGELQVYEDVLELVPATADAIEIVTPAPAVPWVAIKDLTAMDAGQVVRLRGVLGSPKGFSAGIKVSLDDGTGTLPVVLWSNIAEQLAQAPAEGMLVEVVGEVSLYRDALELVPRSVFDWRTE